MIVGLLWIGYIAWPLRDLAVLVQAIDAHDVTSVLDHVNFDRVRVSLAEQVAAASARRSGIQSIPIPQQAIVAGLSIADPVINKLVSPEALSEFLAVGWPVAIAGKPPQHDWNKPSDTGNCVADFPRIALRPGQV